MSDLKQQLVPGQTVKKRLKRGAIPSLFSFGPQQNKSRRTSERRVEQRYIDEGRDEVSWKTFKIFVSYSLMVICKLRVL